MGLCKDLSGQCKTWKSLAKTAKIKSVEPEELNRTISGCPTDTCLGENMTGTPLEMLWTNPEVITATTNCLDGNLKSREQYLYNGLYVQNPTKTCSSCFIARYILPVVLDNEQTETIAMQILCSIHATKAGGPSLVRNSSGRCWSMAGEPTGPTAKTVIFARF